MKNSLRIVFMGTPEFAVASLEKLVKNDYNIVGVITAPDRPAGRGRKLNESAVKKYAQANGLKLMQPINLKDEEFLKELESLEANLQIVVAFRMLPKQVWDMPVYGTFNLHASLLPEYRGAAPIHWAIINGESKTGVTTFFIDEKIDTGEIILQEEIEIEDDETVGSLHDKLMDLGGDLILKTVNLIENGYVKPQAQPKTGNLKTANKLHRENCKINWEEDVDTIYNRIRGLNPFPAAWSYLQNGLDQLSVKIFKVNKTNAQHQYNIGKIICTTDALKIAVNNGFIIIKEIQLPGKRKMDVKSLLNGFEIKSDAKML